MPIELISLISVACLIKNSYSVSFNKTIVIYKNESFICSGYMQNNLQFIKSKMYSLLDNELINNSKRLIVKTFRVVRTRQKLAPQWPSILKCVLEGRLAACDYKLIGRDFLVSCISFVLSDDILNRKKTKFNTQRVKFEPPSQAMKPIAPMRSGGRPCEKVFLYVCVFDLTS